MDALTISSIALTIVTVVNVFLDHSWAPELAWPFAGWTALYLLIFTSLRFRVHGDAVTGAAFLILLWVGAFLSGAQSLYLVFAIEAVQVKRSARQAEREGRGIGLLPRRDH